jgi:hypothetical protein
LTIANLIPTGYQSILFLTNGLAAEAAVVAAAANGYATGGGSLCNGGDEG